MSIDVKYTTEATATGGRTGHARTTDGSFEVNLMTPKELGGAGGAGNNPEQLFAAGYSACFLGALKYAASHRDKIVSIPEGTTVTAKIGVGFRSAGGFGLTAHLTAKIPDVDREIAQALMAEADQVCPYSNALRGNVDVGLSVA